MIRRILNSARQGRVTRQQAREAARQVKKGRSSFTQVSDFCGEGFNRNDLISAIIDQQRLSEIANRKFTTVKMSANTRDLLPGWIFDMETKSFRISGLEIELVDDFHDGLFSLDGEVVE